MKTKTLITGSLVIAFCSFIGIALGQKLVKVAFAKEPTAKKSKANRSATPQAISQCPVIEGDTSLSLFAEDYSRNEGLGAPRHGGVSSNKITFKVTGIAAGARIPLTLSFGIHYDQTAVTQPSSHPAYSGSIAQSTVSIYLAGGGSNFLISGDTLASRGGVTSHKGSPLPSGDIDYTVNVSNNQTVVISSTIQASAVTSTESAYARTFVALDLLNISIQGTTQAGSVSRSAMSNHNTAFFPCDPCGNINKDIADNIAILKDRYDKMLNDQYDLYKFAYDTPIGRSTTWLGHQFAYNVVRFKLIFNVIRAEYNNCIVDPVAYDWMYKQPPDKPMSK